VNDCTIHRRFSVLPAGKTENAETKNNTLVEDDWFSVFSKPCVFKLNPLVSGAMRPNLSGNVAVRQFMRRNWLLNRVFTSCNDLLDHCCDAWNKLADQPWKIM
jgi:hypothetical protein